MSDKKWYRWPEGYLENYVPWFVILRRLLFWPLLLLGKSITFVGVTGGFGLKEAIRNWRQG